MTTDAEPTDRGRRAVEQLLADIEARRVCVPSPSSPLSSEDRLARAVAGMRRPELALPKWEDSERAQLPIGLASLARYPSLPIASDASVPEGEMLVPFDYPAIREAAEREWRDEIARAYETPPGLREALSKIPSRPRPAMFEMLHNAPPRESLPPGWSIIGPRYIAGVDLAAGPDTTVIATLVDGKVVNVRRVRRPWRLVGRARTRALWRKRGRR